MSITTCQLYNDNKGALNTWAKGHYRPQQFEFDLWMAIMEIFNEGRAEWENNQLITDKNRWFFKNSQVPIEKVPQGAMIKYPDDYVSFSSFRFFSKTQHGPGVKCKTFDIVNEDSTCRPLREEEKVELLNEEELFERQITKVDNQRWGSVGEHLTKYPTIKSPYGTQLEGGFKVVPKEVAYVVLNYLRVPIRPIFQYSDDGRGNIICGPNCSLLEYGPEVLPDIMSRIKMKYSSSVGDEQKYAEAGKEKRELVG